jgi:hypothetical protein
MTARLVPSAAQVWLEPTTMVILRDRSLMVSSGSIVLGTCRSPFIPQLR